MTGPHQARRGTRGGEGGTEDDLKMNSENQRVCRNTASLGSSGLGGPGSDFRRPSQQALSDPVLQSPFVRQKALLQVANFRFQVSAGFSAPSPLQLP